MDLNEKRWDYINVLKKCCELNEIGPSDFFASSLLIMLEEFLQKGGSMEQFQKMVNGALEKMVKMIELASTQTQPPA